MVAQIDKGMVRRRPLKAFGRLFAWAFVEGRPLTTSGRWINPLVFAGYGVSKRIPARRQADAPIFIIGTGRSGTTILGKLFAVHREVVFLNEPKAIWHHVQPDEDIAGNYTTDAVRVRLAEGDADPRKARTISRLYSTAMRAAFASRVVDKYPELIFRMPFVRALFPKARFIAIQRDGVQTCASIDRWSKTESLTRDAGQEDWWGLEGRKWNVIVEQLVPEHDDLADLQPILRNTEDDRDRAVVEWIVSSRELRRIEGDEDVMVVKYEDLCASPEASLRSMFDHAGLTADAKMLDYARENLRTGNLHGGLSVMSELVEPFRRELEAAGYADSAAGVTART